MKGALAVAGSALALASGGWTTHRVASFAIGLPASWLDIGHRTRAVSTELVHLEATHPGALVHIASLKLDRNVKFVAIETDGVSLAQGYPAYVRVSVGSTSVRSQAELEQALIDALRDSGLALIGPVGHSRISLPAGPAVVAKVAFRDEETGESATLLQYALLHGGSVYVLSYSSLAGRFASYRPTFARSAASFRFAG